METRSCMCGTMSNFFCLLLVICARKSDMFFNMIFMKGKKKICGSVYFPTYSYFKLPEVSTLICAKSQTLKESYESIDRRSLYPNIAALRFCPPSNNLQWEPGGGVRDKRSLIKTISLDPMSSAVPFAHVCTYVTASRVTAPARRGP